MVSKAHQIQKRKSSLASIEKSPVAFPISKFEDVPTKDDGMNEEEVQLVIKQRVDENGIEVCQKDFDSLERASDDEFKDASPIEIN